MVHGRPASGVAVTINKSYHCRLSSQLQSSAPCCLVPLPQLLSSKSCRLPFPQLPSSASCCLLPFSSPDPRAPCIVVRGSRSRRRLLLMTVDKRHSPRIQRQKRTERWSDLQQWSEGERSKHLLRYVSVAHDGQRRRAVDDSTPGCKMPFVLTLYDFECSRFSGLVHSLLQFSR